MNFQNYTTAINNLHDSRMKLMEQQIKIQNLKFYRRLILIIGILLLICLSSCGSTWVVQGVEVHSPSRQIQRHDAMILGAAAVAGYLAVDQLMEPQQKEKIRKAIGAN
jgi:hypothetical protein